MTHVLRPSLILAIGLATLATAGGCRFNNAELAHGMPFAEIEDTVQQAVRLHDSRSHVIQVAASQWGLVPVERAEEDDSVLTFGLLPPVESRLGKSSGHARSFLSFEFEESGLTRARYSNGWLLPKNSHGVSEIKLWRPGP
jgi:hypothetical protein